MNHSCQKRIQLVKLGGIRTVGFMNDEKDLDNKKKLDTEAGQALAQMSDESYLEDVQGVKLCIAM